MLRIADAMTLTLLGFSARRGRGDKAGWGACFGSRIDRGNPACSIWPDPPCRIRSPERLAAITRSAGRIGSVTRCGTFCDTTRLARYRVTVHAEPQSRDSSRHVRHRELRPGHGIPHQAKQRRDGSPRDHRFKHVQVIQRSATNSPATRLTTTGDGLKRARDRGGTQVNQQFRSDPQPPRLTKAGETQKALLQMFH